MSDNESRILINIFSEKIKTDDAIKALNSEIDCELSKPYGKRYEKLLEENLEMWAELTSSCKSNEEFESEKKELIASIKQGYTQKSLQDKNIVFRTIKITAVAVVFIILIAISSELLTQRVFDFSLASKIFQIEAPFGFKPESIIVSVLGEDITKEDLDEYILGQKILGITLNKDDALEKMISDIIILDMANTLGMGLEEREVEDIIRKEIEKKESDSFYEDIEVILKIPDISKDYFMTIALPIYKKEYIINEYIETVLREEFRNKNSHLSEEKFEEAFELYVIHYRKEITRKYLRG